MTSTDWLSPEDAVLTMGAISANWMREPLRVIRPEPGSSKERGGGVGDGLGRVLVLWGNSDLVHEGSRHDKENEKDEDHVDEGRDVDLSFLRFGAMPLDHHRDFLVAIDTEGAFLRAFATTLDIREASAHWST